MFNCTSIQKKITASVLVFLSCFSCDIPEEDSFEVPNSKIDFSFAAAGHVYGEMNDTVQGIHPLFKNVKVSPDSDFLISLGDAVYKSTKSEWSKSINQLREVSDSLIFTIGNHEYGNETKFLEIANREKTYFSFKHKQNLFLVLDSELSPEGIIGDQFQWLKSKLENLKEEENVFICMHKLLWWNRHSVFKKLTPNSDWNTDHMKLNFWTEIEPILNAVNQQVYIIAGDMAGAKENDGYMYHHYENIHLVGTGMGASKESNYLTFNVHENKEVSIKLHSLLSDSVFNLKSFVLPFSAIKKRPLKQY